MHLSDLFLIFHTENDKNFTRDFQEEAENFRKSINKKVSNYIPDRVVFHEFNQTLDIVNNSLQPKICFKHLYYDKLQIFKPKILSNFAKKKFFH